jgi:tryptophan synthase alpha chain
VAPTTPPDRRAYIASRSQGFLYAVSLAGVTGARKRLPAGVGRFLRDVRAISPVPVAVGFGVSRPSHARTLAQIADGVIVASALVDALGPDGRDIEPMAALVRALAEATKREAAGAAA